MTSIVYSDSSDWHSQVIGRPELRNTALHARSALAMARVVDSFDPELAVEYQCEAENTAFQVGFNSGVLQEGMSALFAGEAELVICWEDGHSDGTDFFYNQLDSATA